MGWTALCRTAVAAVLVLTGAVATGAAADDGTTAEAQHRGERALASLQYPWRDLGYDVRFRRYEGGTLATANSRTRQITVYVRHDQDHQDLRVTIAHELGHALDFEHATAARRSEYREVRGLSRSARWYPCDGCRDYASHAGDWAEVFATWLAGPGDFRSEVAGPPSREQLRRLEPLFRVPSRSASPTASPSPSGRPSSGPLVVLPLPTPSGRSR